MTLNSRMTVTTAVACVLVSTVLLPLFTDTLWFVIGAGAVIAVAGTGALTRLRTLPVSVCLAARPGGPAAVPEPDLRGAALTAAGDPDAGLAQPAVAPGGHRAARREQVRAAGPQPARPAAAGRRRGGHHRRADRPHRGAAAIYRAGRAAAARPVHRAGHHERPALPAHYRAGVLPERGGLPGHAQRRRAGTDPGLGPPGIAVALGAAVRPGAAASTGPAPTGADSTGPDSRARETSRPGYAGAGRGGPPGRARLHRAGLVRAADRARPAREQAVLLRPRHRRHGR